MVGDGYQVVPNSEIDAFKKRIDEDHRRDLRAYEESRRVAADVGVPFDEPRPVKPSVKVLPESFVTKEEAESYRDTRTAG
jgi:hypothetical protein